MGRINKIVIFGGPGSGKTTLAKELSNMFKLPVYHLDALNYSAEWKQNDKQKRDEKILDILKNDKWIIEGNYTSTLEARMKAADLVLFLDYSTLALLTGVFQKLLFMYGKEKEEIPGCKERFNLEFLKYVMKYNFTKREQIYKIMNRNPNIKVVVISNRKSLSDYLSLLKMEEI